MTTFLNHPGPYLMTAAFAAIIIWYSWRQPRRPGTRQFSWLMSVYLIWALAAALSTVTRSHPLLYGLFVLQSICSLLVTALELMVVLEYTGNEKWLVRRVLFLLLLPPLFLIVIAYAFPESVASIEYRSGIAVLVGQSITKWGFYAYVAIIFSICVGVLLACLMRAPAFWAPILLLILGAIIPVAGFAAIRPESITVPPMQASILVTNVTMLTYLVALYSFRILQVIPVARDMLISHMPYGLIVLDSADRLVDFNSAAQTLPELPGKLIVQQAGAQVLGSWWVHLAPLIGSEPVSRDVVVQTTQGARTFYLDSIPLLQASGWRLGQVFLLEDVTTRRQTQQLQAQMQQSLATLQERERLARELHDSLGQTLASAHLQASTARLLLAQGETIQAEKILEQMADMTFTSETDVREYLLGAKAALSSDNLFFPTLRQYVMRFSKQYGLQVKLNIPAQLEAQGLGTAVEVQLLRIIQEALSNVRKHARAKNIQVVFTDSGQQVQIAIIDDGKGFDHVAAITPLHAEGYGLQAMRERAEALGGSIEVVSSPGLGTQVIVQAPIQRETGGGEVVK